MRKKYVYINKELSQKLSVSEGLVVLTDNVDNYVCFDKDAAKKTVKFLSEHFELKPGGNDG